MRRSWRFMAPCLAAVLMACSPQGEPTPLLGTRADSAARKPQGQTITILHVNDSHSHLDAIGPKDENLDGTLGGLAKAATVIKGVRASAPQALLLHAGDVFEGDFYFNTTNGAKELQLLRQLGLTAFALGNHEFNYGPAFLAATLQAAGFGPEFKALSANYSASTESPTGLAPYVAPYVVRTVGGVKVGIFGLTTPFDPLMRPAPDAILPAYDPFADPPQDVQELVAELVTRAAQTATTLRGLGANVVVCLSHLGSELDGVLASALAPELAGPAGIDVVIGGHDEILLPMGAFEAGKTIVVQAGHFYLHVGRLDLTLSDGTIVSAQHELIPVEGKVKRDHTVGQKVDKLKAAIVQQWGDVFHTAIGSAAEALENAPVPDQPRRDTGVGDLAADALRAALPGSHVGLTTQGFLNERIWAGPVVADDLMRALPYGVESGGSALLDPIQRCRMTGALLATALEFGLETGETPQPSGMTVLFDSGASPQLWGVLVGAAPLELDAEYWVATNVVLAQVFTDVVAPMSGLDPPVCTYATDSEPFDQFEALRAYVAANPVLETPAEPRVLDMPQPPP